MFDAASEDAATKAFAERCDEDRHHFRLTVSPEDAGQMADLRAFTRELMKDAERAIRAIEAASDVLTGLIAIGQALKHVRWAK